MDEIEVNLPNVELFVRSSKFKALGKSPCLISQKWIMVFYVMHMEKLIKLKLKPVCCKFRSDNYLVVKEDIDMPRAVVESRLDMSADPPSQPTFNYNGDGQLKNLVHYLKYPRMEDIETPFSKLINELFEEFIEFVVQGKSSNLIKSLANVNDCIECISTKYLLGNELSYLDCLLMPLLQHVRIIWLSFKSYDLSPDFKGLWKYFSVMYTTKAFQVTCPSDRDILFYYHNKSYEARRMQVLAYDNFVTKSLPEYLAHINQSGVMAKIRMLMMDFGVKMLL